METSGLDRIEKAIAELVEADKTEWRKTGKEPRNSERK